MITPNIAASTIGVSKSSLRRWSSQFEDFLDPRRSTKRSYSVGDISTLAKIKELYSSGMTTEEVKAALPIIDRSKQEQALVNVSDFAQALELARVDFLTLQEKVDDQAVLIQELQAEVARLKMPWYKRIFG